MQVFHKSIADIIKDPEACPFPIVVIPNEMGINLCSVDSISWQIRKDTQLVSITVYFKPADDSDWTQVDSPTSIN